MALTDYQSKIAGLLSKAEATDNQHEAEIFSRKAEELMLKWGIEEAVVRAKMHKDAAPERIIRRAVLYKGVYSLAHIQAANAICEGLGSVRVFKKNVKGNTRYMILVGHESDVARAEMLLASLQLQAISAQRAWWKTYWDKEYMTASEKTAARKQFLISFGYAVKERLAAARERETVSAGVGTDLVLADRGARVDAWVVAQFGPIRKGRNTKGSDHGREEGRAAGQRASLGQSNVEGRRVAIADQV